ncbi:Gfo/Idh/MocA family protein [Fructilactobacillus sp. Tb1]|uniref:Gfo/Idh/MocA family protein n=1 Tax=Fructilactobacillus sp. Tb1 TaxID=3422304 RepID=UPI003D2701AC
MIKLGTIGTNWITQRMIEAAFATGKYELGAAYSRHENTGNEFANQNGGAKVYTNLANFMASDEFDTAYIASPNVFHFEQVMLALKNNKNVIVEKPAFMNPMQTQQVLDELKLHPNLRLFEAARNVHMPAFKAVQQALKKATNIAGADFVFSQYSSRYDLVLAGETPNVFNFAFAGGALADLGIYPLYDAVALFGKPVKQMYYPTMIATGADGKGTALLNYDKFDITLNFSKISNSKHHSEIYAGRNIIAIDNGGEFTEAKLISPEQTEVISAKYTKNPMIPEMTDFAAIIAHPEDETLQAKYHVWLQLMQHVNETLNNLAISAGIHYPDKFKE